MPLYRLQFTADSCLTNNADVTVPYKGTEVKFLFSQRGADDRYVRVQADVEAQNNREAPVKGFDPIASAGARRSVIFHANTSPADRVRVDFEKRIRK